MRIILSIIALLFAIAIMIGPTGVAVCGADEAAVELAPAAVAEEAAAETDSKSSEAGDEEDEAEDENGEGEEEEKEEEKILEIKPSAHGWTHRRP